MESVLFAFLGFLIILPIVYYLPLGLSKKGKTVLLIGSLAISLFGLISKITFQWWFVPLLFIILSGLLTILLMRFKSRIVENKIASSKQDKLGAENLKESQLASDQMRESTIVSEDNSSDLEEDLIKYETINNTHDYVHEPIDKESRINEHTDEDQREFTEPTMLKKIEDGVVTEQVEETEAENHNPTSIDKKEDESINIELSPEEELLAARQQTNEQPKQDRELNSETSSLFNEDQEHFVIDEFKEEELEKKDLKQQFEEREGFESFEIDIIEEGDVPSRSSGVMKEDRSEFTDLEDLLNQRNDDYDQKDS